MKIYHSLPVGSSEKDFFELFVTNDFFLKDYLPGKPNKWGFKAWGLADNANGYLLKCDIYKGKKEI